MGFHGAAEANIVGTVYGCVSGIGGEANRYRTPVHISRDSGALSYGGFVINPAKNHSVYAVGGNVRPSSLITQFYMKF